MIQVKNLSKQYGAFWAVKDLSFDIKQGKIYGLLGPNGAGKSTTMNMITGCLSATEGEVLINGKNIFSDPIEAKKLIGYLPELPPLYPEMTPYEYLSFVAEAKGVPYDEAARQVSEVLSLTGVDVVADRLIRNLSKGYKQRVGIAQALLGNPKIVILDEPTVGLDPQQIIEIRSLIRELGKTKTVILSSHILSEINEVCDHVMIISHGKLVANDTIANLEAAVNSDHQLSLTIKGNSEKVLTLLKEMGGIKNIEPVYTSNQSTCCYSMEFDADNDPRETIFYKFAENRLPIIDMTTNHLTLEDVFLKLTSDPCIEEEILSQTMENTENYTPQFTNNSKEDDAQ